VQLVVEVDEHRFARLDVADHLETQGIERDRFGGNQILHAFRRFVLAVDQRPDTVRIAEGEQAIAGNQRNDA
jgi:hypothetical protein